MRRDRDLMTRGSAAIVLAVALMVTAGPDVASGSKSIERGEPTITEVAPSVITSPLDFSSSHRGYWWSFDDVTQYGEEQSRTGWADARIHNGWYIATSTAANPNVRLNNLHGDLSLSHPEEHFDTPFGAAYKHLTLRMCSDSATSAMVFFHRNATFFDLDFGGTVFIPITAGCGVYRWNLAEDGNPQVGRLSWDDGGFTGLRLRPVTEAGVEVKIDFATLSKQRKGDSIAIRWDAADDPVTLFLSDDARGSRRTRIAGNRTGGEFTWRTPNLAPGTYHIVVANGRGRASVGPSFTVDARPQGTILAPGYTSGPDYATTELGNPWDFNSLGDVFAFRNVTNASVGNGILGASNIPGNSDPGVFFNDPASPIDPAAYYNLTYRMRVIGINTPNDFAVVRWAWFIGPSTSDQSLELREYTDWQTISFDMREIPLEPNVNNEAGGCLGAPITKIRLDPHESATQTFFEIDYVKLTSDEVRDKNFVIRYIAMDIDGGKPAARLFFDTDGSPAGRSKIKCKPTDPPPEGEDVCKWLTKNVPDGDYFIQMLLIDQAGNRTTVTSETPVLVRH